MKTSGSSSAPPVVEKEAKQSSRSGILVAIFIVVIAAAGVLLFYSDGQKVVAAAASISWMRFTLPIAATLLSYLLMALSYEGIAAAAGTPVGLWPMLRITFVSNTVNYLVATGGLSGFAVRMYFFQRHGIPVGRAVTVSFVQGLLTNLALMVFLILGFAFLVRHATLGIGALAAAGGLLGVFVIIMGLCLLLLISPSVRRRCLLWSGGAVLTLSPRVLPANRVPARMTVWRFVHKVDDGFGFMVTHWTRMLVPTAYILLDWVATLAVLWGCFWSVGLSVEPALITVGFSVAILSSMVSITPGGLGIMESLTTALFAALGTPLAPTVVALLLFRLAYYALPFAVSLTFCRKMLNEARQHSH